MDWNLILGLFACVSCGLTRAYREDKKLSEGILVGILIGAWIGTCIEKWLFNHFAPQIFGVHPIHFREALFLDVFLMMNLPGAWGAVSIRKEK